MPEPEPANARQLPVGYYLDYFDYLLSFVEKLYADLLRANETGFIARFRALSPAGRALFVRLTNRTGTFFRADKLRYPEIADLPATLTQLLEAGFVTDFGANQADANYANLVPSPDDLRVALDLFTKPELLAMRTLLGVNARGDAQRKKPELLAATLEQLPAASLTEWLISTEPIVQQGFVEEVEMLKFLFFGNIYRDMTEFVLRDLGNFRYENYDGSKFTPRFGSRREADDKFRLSKLSVQLEEWRQTRPAAELFTWFEEWIVHNPPPWEAAAQPVFDKLVLRLATFLERNKLLDEALRLYQHTAMPPSRERQVRLLHKTKRLPEALALCRQLTERPHNADEHFFALDFVAKLEGDLATDVRKRARKSTTAHQQAAEAVGIPVAYRYRVEQGVAQHFADRGWQAIHTENNLWNSFFGLCCWDIIFDADLQTIHHPMQRAPSDFFSPQFLEKRRPLLLARLALLTDPPAMVAHLTRTYQDKYGTVNPLVGWHEGLLDLILVCYAKVPPAALHAVFLEMARNLKEHTHGFPDLFAWNDVEYCFVEVKSPTDHLSAQQLYWQHFFATVGIPARVLRAEWTYDPPDPQ